MNRPYVMDIKSTNGTILNGQKIEDSRYYELKEKDISLCFFWLM